MEPLAPSELFVNFVFSAVKAALQNRLQLPDALERRLWGAASYDAYIISRLDHPLLDAAGKATDVADHYARMIRIALLDYSKRLNSSELLQLSKIVTDVQEQPFQP